MSDMTTTDFLVFGTIGTTDHTIPTEPYDRRSTDRRINIGIYGDQPYIQPCAFDSLPDDCKGKPMLLYCSCPRCSPRC